MPTKFQGNLEELGSETPPSEELELVAVGKEVPVAPRVGIELAAPAALLPYDGSPSNRDRNPTLKA
jgi:hypothetical protein